MKACVERLASARADRRAINGRERIMGWDLGLGAWRWGFLNFRMVGGGGTVGEEIVEELSGNDAHLCESMKLVKELSMQGFVEVGKSSIVKCQAQTR